MNAVHFSSKSISWETPQDLFDALSAKFGPFHVDVCASPQNAKCASYYGDHGFDGFVDGLKQDWSASGLAGPQRCWMNPPYGREIKKWVKKAYEESKLGCLVVCLLPARTDTEWFHEYCLKHGTIEFLKGRLKFSGAKTSAPFPSMIVVFKSVK